MCILNLEYMHKSWSYLTTKLWNGLPVRASGLGCFQVRVAIVYGATLTLRDRFVSGVAERQRGTLPLSAGGCAIPWHTYAR